MGRQVMWAPVDSPGLEHLRLVRSGDGMLAAGLVVFVHDNQPYRLQYAIRMDDTWRVQGVSIDLSGSRDESLRFEADEHGTWHDHAGRLIDEFEGCEIVDISVTPFTNTLAIRRGNLDPGQSKEFDVAYFSVPEMAIRRDRQRYICLERGPQGARYRYEGLLSEFTAELTVDVDALVIDYPGLFRRIWPETNARS